MTFNIFLKNPISCHFIWRKKGESGKVEGIPNAVYLIKLWSKNRIGYHGLQWNLKPYLINCWALLGLNIKSRETCHTSFSLRTPFHPSQSCVILVDLTVYLVWERKSQKLWPTPELLETTFQFLLLFWSWIFLAPKSVFRVSEVFIVQHYWGKGEGERYPTECRVTENSKER